MECYRARELIQEKLAGGLDASLQSELDEHLTGCDACQAFEKGMAKLNDALKRQPLEDAPDGFAARVAAAAKRDRMKILTYERRNLRIAAACIAAVLVVAVMLPFFVALPSTSEVTESLAAAAPALPDASYVPTTLSDFAPQIPESAPTLADAADHLKSSWNSLKTLEIPSLGLSGTLVLLLAVLAAAALAFEAFYFVMPHWRKK
jgi:anti-sigma factor RsiW